MNLLTTLSFDNWIMLTSVLRVLVNNLFEESFDTIFMGNEKNVKILITLFFIFHKNFL